MTRRREIVERIDCQMRNEMKRCLTTVMAVDVVTPPFLGLKSEFWTAAESDMAAA